MNHKNSRYPLELKLAVSLGEEKESYSSEFLKSIPTSTLSDWRKQPPAFYYNQMLESSKQEELIRLFDKQLNNKTREKAALDSYMAFIEFIKLAMGEKEFNKFLTKHKVAYVEYVESLPEVITRKRFLKTTGVSATRFSGWELETKVDCHSSADNVCVKRRPREVT